MLKRPQHNEVYNKTVDIRRGSQNCLKSDYVVCTRHLDIVGFMCHRACFLIEWVHFWAPWWEFGTDWDKLISLSELLEHEFYDKLSLDLCWSSHFSKNWHVCSKYFGQRKNGRLIELSPSAGDKKCLSVSLNMDVMLPFLYDLTVAKI